MTPLARRAMEAAKAMTPVDAMPGLEAGERLIVWAIQGAALLNFAADTNWDGCAYNELRAAAEELSR